VVQQVLSILTSVYVKIASKDGKLLVRGLLELREKKSKKNPTVNLYNVFNDLCLMTCVDNDILKQG